jgi:hypothetical protein
MFWVPGFTFGVLDIQLIGRYPFAADIANVKTLVIWRVFFAPLLALG